jgi:prolipoprotein diacylglyceryltransferase
MFDDHSHPDGFGILPTILGYPTYTLFLALAIAAGALYILHDAQRSGVHREAALEITCSALIFGSIGAKIPILLSAPAEGGPFLGKTIVGGLLGGMLGVMLVKRILKIKVRLGNVIAPAAALGMTIGRIGCFLNGCCYGIPAPWGIDFGDGILRYPTQLFEAAFTFAAFIVLHRLKDRVSRQGILFTGFVTSYLTFRFFIEYIRVEPVVWGGLTLIQLICILGAAGIGLRMSWQLRTTKGAVNEEQLVH